MYSQKIDEYVMTGAQKKKFDDEYELMDFQKTREYEVTGAQKKKIDVEYELMDFQKTREYNLKGAKKTDEYEITGALNTCVHTKKVKNPSEKQFMCRSAEE